MIKNILFKWATRLFLPHLARHMEQEGTFDLDKCAEDYIHIEDCGSDKTIFCFSGMAVLFAGMPQFEFRRILKRHHKDFNLVFFRDTRRMGYYVAPDGSGNGLAFYENKVREVSRRLGSIYNVAVGASGGGTMAMYIGARLGFDHVVAFSPALNPGLYTSHASLLHSLFDVKSLVSQPRAYIESILVTVAGGYIVRKIRRKAGPFPTVEGVYRSISGKPPRVSVFYGGHCWIDGRQAGLVSDMPDVRLIPLDTGHHNCPAYLKKRRELGTTIAREIREALDAAGTPGGQPAP